MNPALQFAIVGCGRISPRHAAEAVKHGRLIAVCDIDHQKADRLAAAYNARAYYSIEDLFKTESPTVTAICTPNGLHAMHSIQSLEGGSHVLCEKPLCISTGDGREMISTAKKNDRHLFVVKSTRYNPALITLKKAVDTGRLGKIFSFQLNCFWNRPAEYYANSWKGDNILDGGTLYTQFSHYIDALLWLLGDSGEVSGIRKNIAHQDCIQFEDSGVVSIEMSSGVIGGINWSVNAFRKNMEVSLTILAEKASISIGGEYMNSVVYELAEEFSFNDPPAGEANDYGFYKGSMSNHDQIYNNLVKVLDDHSHPFTSAEEGLRTVDTIERIYKSVSLR